MTLPGTAAQFTSVTDTGAPPAGLASNLVQTAYDLVLRRALNNNPIFRHFVTVRPGHIAHPGSSIVMQKFNYFSEATVTSMKAALTEEEDVAPTRMPATSTVTITAAEHGAVVSHTKYFEGRSLAAFTPFIAEALADSAAKVLDELIQDQLGTDLTELIVPVDPAHDTLAELDYEDIMVAGTAEDRAIQFIEDNVPVWGGGAYVAVAHPRILSDLRSQAGATGWRIAKEYGNDQVLKTLPNEVGQFDGIRYVSNNRVRTGNAAATGSPSGGQAKYYNTYFFGQGGLAEHVVTEVGAVVSPQVDNLRRFNTIGWYGDLGWKVYEPKAIQIVQTSSSRG